MINITARNFKLTKGIEEHLENKLTKFAKFLNENEKMNVVLESNKYGKKAEVSFKIANKPLRASVMNEDLYVAIDLLADKLKRIIDKNNFKSNNKFSIRYAEPLSQTLDNKQEETSKVVKRKVISLKPMYEEEAIEQMELLDHRSFIFHNASTDTVCMLYKRHDDNYGILETQ